MIVMLTDSTDVGQKEGLLKARSKQMSMAALIPGLAVSVEGDYDNQTVLVASKVRFKGSDLKNAKAIAAGMHDTNQQVQKNQEELQAQSEALQKHQQAIAANKAAVEAATARFGQLDDYYIMDEVTIYFANGKTNVDPKYMSQITTLAQNASKVDGGHDRGKGLCLGRGQPGGESEAQSGARAERLRHSASAGQGPTYQNACPRSDGRKRAGGYRQDCRRPGSEPPRYRARPAEQSYCRSASSLSFFAGCFPDGRSGTTAAITVKPVSRIRRLWHS